MPLQPVFVNRNLCILGLHSAVAFRSFRACFETARETLLGLYATHNRAAQGQRTRGS